MWPHSYLSVPGGEYTIIITVMYTQMCQLDSHGTKLLYFKTVAAWLTGSGIMGVQYPDIPFFIYSVPGQSINNHQAFHWSIQAEETWQQKKNLESKYKQDVKLTFSHSWQYKSVISEKMASDKISQHIPLHFKQYSAQYDW